MATSAAVPAVKRRGRARGIAIAAVVVLIAAGVAAWSRVEPAKQAAVFTGGAARLLCSAIFVGGRDPELARRQDFARLTSPGKYLGLAKTRVDLQDRSVSASIFGLVERKAIFREGLGCTAVEGIDEATLRAQGSGPPLTIPPEDDSLLWPEGGGTLAASLPPGIDGAKLAQALDRAFAEPDPAQPRNTRAVVAVHGGRIIAERYAAGFDRNTAHLGNSMTKTVTGALVGILVGQGRLRTEDPAPVPEWRSPGDPRGAITLDHLLHMASGLQFEENYEKIKSDTTFQYVGGDLGGFNARQPLEVPPGTRWQYSTGTSNLLGRIVRDAAGPELASAFAFPRRALFEPLGMRTAVVEVDSQGAFVGGSAFYASARDAARLGLLYLRDGVWQGRRILPEGWVAYTRTPTPLAPPELAYGVQVWLNTGTDPAVHRWPRMPPDAFVMVGHQGQYVVMVPSHDLVVVRFGLTEFGNWRIGELVRDVIEALPPAAPGEGA